MPLREFLGQTVLIADGHRYSIGNVINYEAAVLSVAESNPDIDPKQVIRKVSEKISPGGISPALRQLRAIGSVLLRAVEPYRDEVSLVVPESSIPSEARYE